MYALFSNAVKATFKDQGNDPADLAVPLAPEKISESLYACLMRWLKK